MTKSMTRESQQGRSAGIKKERSSNLELFRILTMLLIIAHHYVVNSGLMLAGGPIQSDPMAARSLGALLFGAWGKIGINCFVFITGYFMCNSHITAIKYVKLLAEVMFYKIVIGFTFLLSGYEPFSIKSLATMFLPVRVISDGFTSTFLMFYLCIPYLNIILDHINEKLHLRLIGLLALIYIIPAFLPGFSVRFNYVSWFMVLYFISSYVRRYDKPCFHSRRIWKLAAVAAVMLSSASVLAGTWIGTKIGKNLSYYFVTDSNNLLAVVTAFALFMCFKNLNIRQSHTINVIGSTTFGVLLIHANSSAMRRWLWGDLLNVVSAFSKPWFWLHAAGSVALIFAVCSMLDWCRIHWLEKPFLKFADKKLVKWKQIYSGFEDRMIQKLNSL